MSLQKAQTYEISLRPEIIESFISELSANSIPFEFLEPKELGEEWESLPRFQSKQAQHSDAISTLSLTLDAHKPKGFLASFLDTREPSTVDGMYSAANQSDEIISVADRYNQYYTTVSQLNEISAIAQKPGEKVFLGRDLHAVVTRFRQFAQEQILQYKESHQDEEVEIQIPEISVVLTENLEYIILETETAELFQDFIVSEAIPAVGSIDTITAELKNREQELTDKLKTIGLNHGQLPKEYRKKIAQLHAYFEVQDIIRQSQHRFFTFTSEQSRAFAFLAVPSNYAKQTNAVLTKLNIVFEQIDWPTDVVVWSNPGGLQAFQGVAQSMGTIGEREFDPTSIVAFFFMLFFAFCLGDALYGAIISIFTGYFLYFTPLKTEFKNIFNLFFFSGLATVIFGALTNSWAGNLFVETPANRVFEMFQIIDPLNSDSSAPVNQFLANNGGTSPIVALLGTAAVIGLVNILIGYTLKAINLSRANDTRAFLESIGWIGLVTSLIFLIVTLIALPDITIIPAILLAVFTVSQFLLNSGKNPIGKVIGGFGHIYNLVGFFADILSYTRLVAVGLTSGIIATVVNLLASLVFSSLNPVIGGIIAVIILLIGHIFNLVVALFGAYINPLRLHYVEFLPKFYSGEGRNLKPENSSLTYLKLTHDSQ